MFDHCGQGLCGERLVRRARDDLELMNALAAMAVHRAQAVGAGVAAADDDHVLAVGRDEVLLINRVAGAAAVLTGQVIHREDRCR